jgi:hypothetical protein
MPHLSEVTAHLVYDDPHKSVTINPITSISGLAKRSLLIEHCSQRNPHSVPATHKTDIFHHILYQLCYLYTQLIISKHTTITESMSNP